MPMSSMRMSRAPWKPSQSPGKSPEPKFGRQANMLAQLPVSESASKLPDVIRSHARTGGVGADRHAPAVCLARPLGYRADGALGRTGDRHTGAGVAGGGAGADALR